MVGYSNIVFGNSREMEALAQSLNLTYDDVLDIPFLLNSLKRITINVCNTVKKDWLRHEAVFVMTQGASAPAIAVWGKSQSAQVLPIKSKVPIIDTTDADDALAAGFLAAKCFSSLETKTLFRIWLQNSILHRNNIWS